MIRSLYSIISKWLHCNWPSQDGSGTALALISHNPWLNKWDIFLLITETISAIQLLKIQPGLKISVIGFTH